MKYLVWMKNILFGSIIASVFVLVSSCSDRTSREFNGLTGSHQQLLDRAKSQGKNTDSAILLLQAANSIEWTSNVPDSQRIRRVLAMANLMSRVATEDSAFRFLVQEQESTRQKGDSAFLAKLNMELARWQQNRMAYRSASFYVGKAIGYFDRKKMRSELIAAKLLQSSIFMETGELQPAQEAVVDVIRMISSDQKEAVGLQAAMAYRMSANIYSDLNIKDKAIADYRNAYHLFKGLNDSLNMATTYANLGLLYRKSIPDTARWYYDQALQLAPIDRYPQRSVIYLFNRANIELDARRLDMARLYYDSVLAICVKHGIKTGIPRVYSGYATMEDIATRYDQAIKYWDRAIEVSDSLSLRPTTMRLMREKQKTLESAGFLKEALALSAKVKKLDDSLTGVNKVAAIKELELQYETQRREAELLAIKDQRQSLWLIIGILFLTAVVGVSGMFFYRDRNRVNAILVRQFRESLASGEHSGTVSKIPVYPASEPAASTEAGAVDLPEPDQSDEMVRLRAALFLQLESLLASDEVRSDANLRPEDAAQKLGITARELTAVVRQAGEPSFIQYLNRLRVAHAARLLDDPNLRHLKLESIGEMAGFSSRTNFYRVFEQVTGVQPGLYRSIPNAPRNQERTGGVDE